jgi:hypothetical protein
MRALMGLFLVAHGFLTAGIWAAPRTTVSEGQWQPPDPAHSWLLGDVRGLSVVLGIVVGIALVAAGVGFLTHQLWWPPVAIAAAASSLVLFATFFTPWWLAGIAISAALMVGALRAHPV